MNCKKQRNDMTKLNKTAKLEYLNNFKLGKDNKLFWKKWKPYFTNKHSRAGAEIMLNENGELILKDENVSDTFNEYFESFCWITRFI